MKPSIVYIVLGIILMIFDSFFLSLFPIEFFKPDLGIPFIIYMTLFLSPQSGLAAALIIGLFQEVLSNSPNGSLIFTGVSIFLLTTFLKSKLYIDSKYSFSYTCSGFVVVKSFLFLTLSILSKGDTRNFLNVSVLYCSKCCLYWLCFHFHLFSDGIREFESAQQGMSEKEDLDWKTL